MKSVMSKIARISSVCWAACVCFRGTDNVTGRALGAAGRLGAAATFVLGVVARAARGFPAGFFAFEGVAIV